MKGFVTSAYDAAAPSFDRHRPLPEGVAEAIRAAVLDAAPRQPCILDLGAGSGRVGWPFVAAGDNYVGIDLSLAMLHAFQHRTGIDAARGPLLVQADGKRLPFRDAAFDAVMLVQVFGGMRGWRRLLAEARRVLRAAGALVLGRSVAPEDGVDAQMKQRLALILEEMGVQTDRMNARDDVVRSLEANADGGSPVTVTTWRTDRTPRRFIDRHHTGARFSRMPAAIKDEALRKLGAWAETTFDSCDNVFTEQHAFELRIFNFIKG